MLGCLAVAMTAGAVLLSWMEPPGAPAAIPDPEFTNEQAFDAVRLEPGVGMAAWNRIEIESFGTPTGAAHLAARPGNRFHFTVSETGVVHTGPAWRTQQYDRDDAGAIVIGIEACMAEETMPIGSWIGLRTLLIALTDQATREGLSLGVRIRAPASGLSQACAGTLRARLLYDGFLSDAG